MSGVISGPEDREDVCRIGILFSQAGTMSVTEIAHFKGAMVAIEEINAQGGIGGRMLSPVIEDPKSDPDAYRELAGKLMTRERVTTIFGCCSSASRKAVLPVLERHGALLFYPSFYEGFEYYPNVIYGGATPNQTVIPLTEYLFANHGRRFFLVGSNYIYPREINRIVSEFLHESGGTVAGESYVPLGSEPELFSLVARQIAGAKPDAIISTVVGLDTAKLYEACHTIGLTAQNVPIASLTTSEGELAMMSEDARGGHLSAMSYFHSLRTDANARFCKLFEARFGKDQKPNVYAEATYAQVHLYAEAVVAAGTEDSETLLGALHGLGFDAPQGRVKIDPDNNHVYTTPRIGRSRRDGAFDVVWQSPQPVKPDPYLVAYDRTISSSVLA
jgi:ABC-type branched-subunit amino acid transport system substrate-binding protein